jgi:hypothetical protein
MLSKPVALLIIALVTNTSLFSQYIDEGPFDNWDFGPTSVHGNLRLKNIANRFYYKIEKTNAQNAKVLRINPSGVIINTVIIKFVNGILIKVEEMDQWGEIYDSRNFTETKKNEFKVTDIGRGINNLLPCKYAIYVYKNELLSEIQYYSFTGSLTENKNGVAITRYKKYDDSIRFAMIKEISYFDSKGMPVVSKTTEYHKLTYELDNNNNRIRESYFGIDDKPCTIPKTQIAGVKYTYDENNNELSFEYFNLDNKLTTNYVNVAMSKTEYKNGYSVKGTRYDTLNQIAKPASSGDGFAIVKTEYDSAGNKINQTYFDENESPINDHSGVHEVICRYSPANMLIRLSFFNVAGKPSVNRDKAHTIFYTRDSLGRIIDQTSYGMYLEPVKNYTDKVYMVKYGYDKFGRKDFESYWKDSSTVMPRWNGIYQQRTLFDEDGQNLEFHYLDSNGIPQQGKDGASWQKLIYNKDGTLAERRFLHDNNLIMRKSGVTNNYAVIIYKYDSSGKVNELDFLDTKRKPVNATIYIDAPFPANKILLTYRGNRIIEENFYDKDPDIPAHVIDCLKSDYITTNGISTGRRNIE